MQHTELNAQGSLLLLFEMPPQALTVSSHHMPQTKAQRSAMSVNHLRKRERQVQPCWDELTGLTTPVQNFKVSGENLWANVFLHSHNLLRGQS